MHDRPRVSHPRARCGYPLSKGNHEEALPWKQAIVQASSPKSAAPCTTNRSLIRRSPSSLASDISRERPNMTDTHPARGPDHGCDFRHRRWYCQEVRRGRLTPRADRPSRRPLGRGKERPSVCRCTLFARTSPTLAAMTEALSSLPAPFDAVEVLVNNAGHGIGTDAKFQEADPRTGFMPWWRPILAAAC